jgi:3-oxoacyl-[acyl-carrier protein] reductase
MDLRLSGKVAWVLGGSSGLGRGSAESLAWEGAAVAISARDPERLETAANEIREKTGGRVVAVPLDVSDGDAIAPAHERVVAELGEVDILVANAGGPTPGTFDTNDTDDLDAAFHLTLRSAWLLSKAVEPAMLDGGRGVIAFITSSSTKEPISGILLSNVFRPGVTGMAKTMATELGPHGIRVFCVAPGRIDTARVRNLDKVRADASGRSLEDVARESGAAIPLGRYGTIEEFGDVVAFMCSERASYVSGTTVVVDGGALHGLLA